MYLSINITTTYYYNPAKYEATKNLRSKDVWWNMGDIHQHGEMVMLQMENIGTMVGKTLYEVNMEDEPNGYLYPLVRIFTAVCNEAEVF